MLEAGKPRASLYVLRVVETRANCCTIKQSPVIWTGLGSGALPVYKALLQST